MPNGQCPNQTLANLGFAGGEATGPGNSGRVVAPCSSMLVLKGGCDLFEHQEVEQKASHFQVIDGQFLGFIEGCDVGGPADAPDSGVEAVFSTEPDSAGTKLASI